MMFKLIDFVVSDAVMELTDFTTKFIIFSSSAMT